MNGEDVKNYGRLNDPTASAWIKGVCGDTMEIYLIIESLKTLPQENHHTIKPDLNYYQVIRYFNQIKLFLHS